MAEPWTTPAKGLIVAAPASGSGKTTATLGLIAALRRRGLKVAAAKTGPDYIDPQFLAAAAETPCITLDAWAMSRTTLRGRLAERARDKDIVVVEGVMGLFDGAEGGGGSTADLAELLDLPVVLVVDAGRQAQSIAAVVHGFDTFRPGLELAGVIATRVGSDRHAAMIAGALAEMSVPYLGFVASDAALQIASRHLGLVQAQERAQLAELVDQASRVVAENVDLDGLLDRARPIAVDGEVQPLPPLGQRIAVAHDVAFGFHYPHMLEGWRRQGAEIAMFSPLADEAPADDCDAVFLPGGYPELHAGPIAAAATFQDGMRAAADRGAVVYGECGGYMVLGEALIDENGERHQMLGLLGHVTSFARRQRHLGYRKLETLASAPLPGRLRGHEFHYSTLAEAGGDPPLFRARDSADRDLGEIGGRRGRVCGSYAHILDVDW